MGEKLSQAAVNYRPAQKERRCGNCVSFDPSGKSCALVSGQIEPHMCCDRWRPLKHSGRP